MQTGSTTPAGIFYTKNGPGLIKRKHILKVNFPGGIVPAGDLLSIVKAALPAGVGGVRFGGRQQLLMKVYSDKLEPLLAALAAMPLSVELDTDLYPNIMSSCVAEQMTHTGGWLKEGVYKDVLESFDTLEYRPRLTVNLVDPGQSLVPFNTGQLNFIAAGMGNYWHLLLRLRPQQPLYEWKSLVYSGNIAQLTRRLQQYLLRTERPSPERMYEEIMQAEQWIGQLPADPLVFPDFALPYYEGFNRNGEQSWLGIYRRDELFPLPFLMDLCTLCVDTKLAQLYITPWKSLVIQGIHPRKRKGWDIILGRHGVNVRHSLCELSWQVEDISEEGLALKHYLVRQFDRDDIRIFGLCFSIQLLQETTLFGLVLIRLQQGGEAGSKAQDRYEILYRNDFNPRSDEYILFRKDMKKEHLATYLKSLCKYFYDCKAGEEMILHHVYRHRDTSRLGGKSAGGDTPAEAGREVQECRHCLTVYDPALGDPEAGVPAGTALGSLAEYSCPVCGSDKSAFRPMSETSGQQYEHSR
jgi:rubredoxin